MQRAALARFLPTVVREAFEEKVQQAGILPSRLLEEKNNYNVQNLSWIKNLQKTKFNETKSPYDEAMIPDVIFYDNKQVTHFYLLN